MSHKHRPASRQAVFLFCGAGAVARDLADFAATAPAQVPIGAGMREFAPARFPGARWSGSQAQGTRAAALGRHDRLMLPDDSGKPEVALGCGSRADSGEGMPFCVHVH
jgi:hypothetical protein